MVALNSPIKHRILPIYGEPFEFKRGLEKVPVKKIQRKLNVRWKHIILFFLVIAGFFFGLMKGDLYLINCDDFAVKKAEIACRQGFVGLDIRALLNYSELVNLHLHLNSASSGESYQDKLALAWKCLDALTPEQRLEVEALDLSDPGCVSLYLLGQMTRLVLGGERFSERLAFIRTYKDTMEVQNGPLGDIALRFADAIIFKPLPFFGKTSVPH